jgi:hypothetical protein
MSSQVSSLKKSSLLGFGGSFTATGTQLDTRLRGFFAEEDLTSSSFFFVSLNGNTIFPMVSCGSCRGELVQNVGMVGVTS